MVRWAIPPHHLAFGIINYMPPLSSKPHGREFGSHQWLLCIIHHISGIITWLFLQRSLTLFCWSSFLQETKAKLCYWRVHSTEWFLFMCLVHPHQEQHQLIFIVGHCSAVQRVADEIVWKLGNARTWEYASIIENAPSRSFTEKSLLVNGKSFTIRS